jgi:hypothetical protein
VPLRLTREHRQKLRREWSPSHFRAGDLPEPGRVNKGFLAFVFPPAGGQERHPSTGRSPGHTWAPSPRCARF